MAPVKKFTQKEIGLQERPWINSFILVAMSERNTLHKDFLDEKIISCAMKSMKFIKQNEIWLLLN